MNSDSEIAPAAVSWAYSNHCRSSRLRRRYRRLGIPLL